MRGAALLATMLLVVLLSGAESARAAEFGIAPGSLSIQAVDGSGKPDNRAGAHPDRLRIGFELTEATGTALKDLAIELPPGLAGDPQAVPFCPPERFDRAEFPSPCPPESQIGTATIRFSGQSNQFKVPVLNVEPTPGELGVFGFNLFLKVPLQLSLRPGDFGLDIEQSGFGQGTPLSKASFDLWGVPADHQETSIPRRPFLATPTRCGKPLEITVRVRSWQPGASWQSATAASESPLSGCQNLPFEPRLGFDLANRRADSPTGAQIDLVVPQSEDPDGLASSQVKSAEVFLPSGMTVSPGVVAGLSTCSDAQLAQGLEAEATCPSNSRIGSIELAGPALREPLTGSLYMGQERPGERFRLFTVAKGLGAEAKVTGSLRTDPATGRLVAVLAHMPEVSFSRLSLRFDDGPRALLVTPLDCGPATAVAKLDPYSDGPQAESRDTVDVGGAQGGAGCSSEPFAPRFVAGTSNAGAGRPTAFSMTLQRSDGEAPADRLSVVLPAGLSAKLGGLDRCDPMAASLGGCPAAARIGGVVAQVGAGPQPATLHGEAYLTGPYRGAPFGLALTFDAALGPFNLGSVTVRGRLRLDPRSGQVMIETDALPRAIEGLPVRFRTIGIDIDRPGVIHNPTSCRTTAVEASVRSIGGATAQLSSPFTARGCSRLGFRPRVSMAMTQRRQLRRHGHPGLRIGVRMRPGGTNLRNATIRLPRTLGFDASGLAAICTRRDATDGDCPAESRVGTATARSPLLDSSLSGSIYVVQPDGTGLPDLWTVIRGLGVMLEVRSEAEVAKGRVSTKLANLPDIPLSSFVMRLGGGKHGILSLVDSPCGPAARDAADLALEGQDGAFRTGRVEVKHPDCAGTAAGRAKGGALSRRGPGVG